MTGSAAPSVTGSLKSGAGAMRICLDCCAKEIVVDAPKMHNHKIKGNFPARNVTSVNLSHIHLIQFLVQLL